MSLYSDLNEVLTPYAQRIKGVKADLGVLDDNVFSDVTVKISPEWASGGINNKNGNTASNSKKIRWNVRMYDKTVIRIAAKTGYKFQVYAYDSSNVYLGQLQSDGTLTPGSLDHFHTDVFLFDVWKVANSIKITLSNTEYTDINTSESINVIAYENPLEWIIPSVEDMINPDMLTISQDNMWSWWIYPQLTQLQRIRNCLYWGFCTASGGSGVAQYNLASKHLYTNILKNSAVDDHSSVAVLPMSNGKIMCAYSGGHNEDRLMHIKVSSAAEDITAFDSEVLIQSSGSTSYAQLLEYNKVVYLFYRTNSTKWAYVYSTDYGVTWSDETIMITASMQYYCMVRNTTTGGTFRVLCYSNPGLSDVNIRQAFFRTSDRQLYNSDNSTLLGTNVDATNISVLISAPTTEGKTQRLFDCAKTAASNPQILYSVFSREVDNESEYFVYNSGTITKICDGGVDLWHPKYQLGASWGGADRIVIARNENSKDIVELYAFANNTLTLLQTIAEESTNIVSGIAIRNARPIMTDNNAYMAWLRGYYYAQSYKKFNTDAHVKKLG